MNIVCTICSELLVPSDDIFHTPCGHIFHFSCLIRWLERSKTCPHCRDRTTEDKIHRIYFNFSNNDNIVEDFASLQEKIDNLTFQLKLRDNDIKHFKESKEKLQRQTAGLRQEVRNVESEINSKNSAMHALKEQIKFYKQQNVEAENNKKEIERLKKKVEDLRNLQILIDASTDDVDEMIARTRDPSTLVTYIAVMKREMTSSFNKRRDLRNKVRSLQMELTNVSMERNFLSEEHAKRKELEERLMICESEKISLQSRLYNIEVNMSAMRNGSDSVSDTHTSAEKYDNPKEPNLQEKPNTIANRHAEKLDSTPKINKDDSCIIIDGDCEGNTPECVKSQGFFSINNRNIKRASSSLKVPSILAKKSKFDELCHKVVSNDMTFDGFGGHARYDKFPNPIKGPQSKRKKEEVKVIGIKAKHES